VRAAYRTAEGDVLDLEGWRNAFTEDAVFIDIAGGGSYSGDRLGDVVTYMANLLPDVHRELLRVHDTGDDVVVIELLIQGTFLGPVPTPAGPLARWRQRGPSSASRRPTSSTGAMGRSRRSTATSR
jgi:hypothetical protein